MTEIVPILIFSVFVGLALAALVVIVGGLLEGHS